MKHATKALHHVLITQILKEGLEAGKNMPMRKKMEILH